jgi:hypothetical protein
MEKQRLGVSRSHLRKIISVFYAFGHNQYNLNNKASKENKDNIHAEVDCVNRLKKSEKIAHINLIVFRTNNNGDKLMNAKPCSCCIKTIDFALKQKNYKLKKLCYSDEDGNICVL